MKRYLSHSTEETEQIAAEFASTLKSGDVIAYKGPMGAGKTAFTRGLCKGLGLSDHVSSPTFALVHQYGNGSRALYHFDMYRVETFEDLYSTGFFDYLDYKKRRLLFLATFLPFSRLIIFLKTITS